MNSEDLLEYIVRITAAPMAYCSLSADKAVSPIKWHLPDGCKAPDLPLCILALAAQSHRADMPVLACVGSLQYYAILWEDEHCFVLGPVHLSAALAVRHNFPAADQKLPSGDTAICDIPVFLYSALLIQKTLTGTAPESEELLTYNCSDYEDTDIQRYYSKLVFDNREEGQQHNSFSHEQRLMSSIEQGDLPMLKKCLQEKVSGAFGKLAPTMERSARDLGISVIVLASRAAIRGGVNYEQAFSLCDSYIMRIETMQDLHQLQPLVEGAQLKFAALAHEVRTKAAAQKEKGNHPLVEKCKNYALTQLHGKISLNDVAQVLGTNPSYLSTLFKQYEGISFSNFVMEEKINLAKSLLIYSQHSYGEIAATLGFSSQSHMGKHFKQLTGMTPIQFRQRYGKTEISD